MTCLGSSSFQLSIESDPGLLWEDSPHHFNQSNTKLKAISIWSIMFTWASSWLPVFTLNSHWSIMMLTFALIGSYDYLGFGFLILSCERLWWFLKFINWCVIKLGLLFFSRVKLYAVFQGLREEGFDLSKVLSAEFVKRCHKAFNEGETSDRHLIQKLLKTGMSLGMSSFWSVLHPLNHYIRFF